MNNQEINMSERFKINEGKGIIRSVSIILFSSKYGFLLCDEMRNGFPDTSIRILGNHIIGGKVEMDDISPLYTGFREFIEELDFYLNDMDKKEMINFFINELNNCKTLKWDYCVNENKQLYNRFYVISLDNMINEEVKNQILSFLLNWKKKENSVLEKVYFWKKGEPLIAKTTLLQTFINNIPPISML